MIDRILAIAINTLREAIRSKLLYILLGFAVLLILAGIVVGNLSYVERPRILQDVGFAAIRLFSVAIAVFVGVGLIYREVDRRTVYTILSKPTSRSEFLIGKYCGLVVTLWLQIAIMVAIFSAVSWIEYAPLTWTHAAAVLLIGIETILVVALATLFSSFTTPILASFFSVGLWVVGSLTRNLRDLGEISQDETLRLATRWVHRLLPDLASFDLVTEAVHELPIDAGDVVLPVLYGLGYAALVLLGATAIFERRDLR